MKGELRSSVLQALAELRYAKPRDVSKHIGDQYTEEQVRRALNNAKHRGLIESSGVTRIKGQKNGAPAIYWLPGDAPPPELENEEEVGDLFEPNRYYPKRPAYASVWHYAQGIGASAQPRRVSSVWDLANDSQRARA